MVDKHERSQCGPGKVSRRVSHLRVIIALVLSFALAYVTISFQQDLKNLLLGGQQQRDVAKPLRPFLSCSNEVRRLQVERFHQNRTHWNIQCAPHVWMDAYRDAAGPGHLILFDIGCNKGYFSAELFNAFVPELGVNKLSLWQAYGTVPPFANSLDPVYRCSSACDNTYERCTEVKPAPPSAWLNRSVEIHCFEPSSLHVERMTGAKQQLSPRLTAGSVWHIHQLPVTDKPREVKWPKNCDTELCNVLPDDTQGNVDVMQATTVDAFLEATFKPNQRIAAIKVDAEGFDPAVIDGATSAMLQKRVDIIMFEYHHVNYWLQITLESVVFKMNAYGMVCYFEGHGYLFKLSRGCWHPDFEICSWSNVVCALKDSWVENALDGITWLKHEHPQQFSANSIAPKPASA